LISRAYVGFILGGVGLALEATKVLSVASSRGVVPVPFARSCVAGVLFRHGRLVPIVDLCRVATLWNIVPRAGGDQVLVLGLGEIEAGFLASAVETFRSGEGGQENEGAQPPPEVREAILSGTLRAGDRVWGLLKANEALMAAGLPAA
jgi:chemotaxis signal transduction protein